MKVFANDLLNYWFHIARVIVENNNVHLSTDEIEALLQPNPKADDFVRTTFRGKFFQSGVHPLIDTIRANIEELKGCQKDILTPISAIHRWFRSRICRLVFWLR